MKGVVRKRLAALLSVAGFAGTASHATAQTPNNSKPGDKIKSESTLKTNKAAQEKASTKDVVTEKMRKAGGEQTAVGANVAHKASISSGGDRAKTDAQIKMNKADAEKASATSASGYKEAKAKAATGAAQKKMDQASPK